MPSLLLPEFGLLHWQPLFPFRWFHAWRCHLVHLGTKNAKSKYEQQRVKAQTVCVYRQKGVFVWVNSYFREVEKAKRSFISCKVKFMNTTYIYTNKRPILILPSIISCHSSCPLQVSFMFFNCHRMTIGQDFWLFAPHFQPVWPIVPVVKESSGAFTLRAIKNRHSCQPESAKWQRAHKNASYAFQIMQISRVNFEDQRIARKSLRKPENGLLFRHCCCTHRVAQWWRWVWWSLLVVLCAGVCELCIWQQHEMGWNFCRLLLPPSH